MPRACPPPPPPPPPPPSFFFFFFFFFSPPPERECVRARARERERESARARARARERERERGLSVRHAERRDARGRDRADWRRILAWRPWPHAVRQASTSSDGRGRSSATLDSRRRISAARAGDTSIPGGSGGGGRSRCASITR